MNKIIVCFILLTITSFAQQDIPATKVKLGGGFRIQASQYTGDSYVFGRIGIGIGMYEVYSFSHNTMAIKANNIRMKFEDTSSPTFPDEDWIFEFNSSDSVVNGGSNYLKLHDSENNTNPFTIWGGGNRWSLFVGGNGNIGIGTLLPSTKLHLRNCNYPRIHLSNSTTAVTIGGNESYFSIQKNSSGSIFHLLPREGDYALYLASNGNVGVGTNQPKHQLHVEGTMNVVDDKYLYFGDPDTDDSWRIMSGYRILVFEKRINDDWVERFRMEVE